MPLKPDDTILNGKYRIVRLIAKGGMARVWLAEELTFGGRLVALKEPRDDLLPDLAQEVRLRYQREVQVCAALEEAGVPNIVRAITADPYDDTVLLAMQYMPGGDLAALMEEHPDGLPVERLVSIALDLLAALEGVHAHKMEIVHRDVKPSNVLFDEQGRAHLADFGLAQLAGMSGRSQLAGGQHPGTPMYMAPEQELSPRTLTPAADLYAVGCLLFEMLTGTRYKRVRPGTLPGALRAEVPRGLDGVVAKALAEDPWERYAEAAEMAAAIGEAEEARRREAARARAQAAEEARRREAEERARAQAAEEARRREEERAQIWQAIDAGDTDGARGLLRQALASPTAETYYLASLVASHDQQRIEFLEKALDLNPNYRPAMEAMGRASAPLQGGQPASTETPAPVRAELTWQPFSWTRFVRLILLGAVIGAGYGSWAVRGVEEWVQYAALALHAAVVIGLIVYYARSPRNRRQFHFQVELAALCLIGLPVASAMYGSRGGFELYMIFENLFEDMGVFILMFWLAAAPIGALVLWLARRRALRKE